ncbi:MAG: tetratricopeptide repeat protein, partial [Candidatus Coatesbacteria bacterium]|nr:tetratricopeptide repeat protein [Candidatus Coatesbacteria bacterium]
SVEATRGALSHLKAGFDAEYLPYLHHLFGTKDPEYPLPDLAPSAVKDNLWIAIRKLLESWAREKPLLLFLEDMHWADGGTMDFLEYLSEFVNEFPIIVLLLYRPGSAPEFAKNEGLPLTRLVLSPLSRDAENDLLRFYLADGENEWALIRRIRRYSEGNPLFAEEFLHMLLERGIVEIRDGKMHLTEKIEKMPLPTGISGVLGDRFDRLSRADRRIAYYGAVIGRSFLHSLLSDIHGKLHGASPMGGALGNLLSREIIFQKAVGSDLEYIFKHALTREMLVSRLVDSLRRELSRLIAMRIEELFESRLEEFHGTLSEHYEIAGDVEKAARHAGLHAIHNVREQQNFEAQEAFERYDRLLAKCAAGDSNEATIASAGVLSNVELANLIDSRIALLQVLGRREEAFPLCDRLGELENGRWRTKALNWRAKIKYELGEYEEALALLQRALHQAGQDGDRSMEAASKALIGTVSWRRGDYDGALECFGAAGDIYRELGDKSGIARTSGNIGVIYKNRGNYEEALRGYGEALKTFTELGDKAGIGTVLVNTGNIHKDLGEYDKALNSYREGLVLQRELGDKAGIAMFVGNVGAILAEQGEFDEALKCYNEALSKNREIGDRAGMAFTLSNIGNVYDCRGDYDEALRYYEEALAIDRELGDKAWLAHIISCIAVVHAELGDRKKALGELNESLAMRRDIGDKVGAGTDLTSIAAIQAIAGNWAESRMAAEEAERISRETGHAEYAPDVLSILTLCAAAEADWARLIHYLSETTSIIERAMNPSQVVLCNLNLARAYIQIARWFDEKTAGEGAPLSREEAILKATECAKKARDIAGGKSMAGQLRKAEALLEAVQ